MTLNLFYKQFSGNDSFETPEDRQLLFGKLNAAVSIRLKRVFQST